MVDVADEGERLKHLDQLELKADLIRVCRESGLEEFSGDGRFLVVHPLDEMMDALGGQRDDAENFFTARLLLLLESQCLFNQAVYDSVVNAFIGEYFREYPDHPQNFVPGFLVNDIVRFWKTMCLNYEFDRGKMLPRLTKDPVLRLKFKLKTLKLAFSRLMTCYSALVYLAFLDRAGTTTARQVIDLVALTPIERLEHLGTQDANLLPEISVVLEHYGWFLENLGGDKREATRWLQDEGRRRDADDRAREYREAYKSLLLAAGEGQVVKFIIV